jgi:hypothetical protein
MNGSTHVESDRIGGHMCSTWVRTNELAVWRQRTLTARGEPST